MSKNATRVSIVVATKDRYETLFDCVTGLLLNYDRDDVEIIVRDNSARPRTQDFITRFGDRHNVIFRYDPTPVSQSENYELAVALACGDFVTMIGDDDGVAGGLLEIAAWMDQYALDAFLPGTSVYLWPGVSGRLSASNPDGWLRQCAWLAPRLLDVERARRAVLASGCTSLKDLPCLYHGLVRRNCLDRVRADAGACFPGPSPDMANAFALSYVVGRMAIAQLPLFISGNSRNSAAGLGLRGKHVGEIPDLPFLPRDTTAHWNPCIPYFWSGQTIWCQSAYASATALGRTQEFDALNNYRALFARVLVFQPGFAGRLVRAFRARYARDGVWRMGIEVITTLTTAAGLWVTRIVGFAQRRLRARGRPGSGGRQATGLPSIVDATQLVDAAMIGTDLRAWLDLGLHTSGRSAE